MSEENNSQELNNHEQADGPNFAIQRIFLKDISFETPMGVEAFTKQFKPNIQQDLNVQVNQLDEGTHEVVLLLTITAKIEGRTVFLVEVKQAGIFAISGFEGIQLSQVINTACPQILFPYAREAIDSILNRGTFPPLMLAPINFDAVFAQAVVQAKQQAESSKETAATAN
ncbi:protein-export chaperone SecB [Cellvibrio sp. PSBB006]|jgi:preprotein translocase subunit SecB|uniref:protein-export chaperone SecB n=1 Tax=Cellvibrio sp. PSBB006 TaxID=1987723 RepID=UPI000B3B2919|nr:protein-export chaperone SecB [Cellvibrio sp. PSBB006]ARU28732.1 protein-export chaperone SecB [Cellvibrio sp. PSBB006]